MWHANEASSHHASFGRTSGITNTRMPPLQICGHCRARPKSNAVLSTRRPHPVTTPSTARSKERRVQVLVRDNNVDQALKVLKKKMQREGIFREMKLRGQYEKPSEKRV